MRESIYKSVDVIIFCFSLSNLQISKEKSSRKKGSSSHISLGHIKDLWLPEVEKALGEAKEDDEKNNLANKKDFKTQLPIKLLVGTKSDQIFENAEQLFTQEDESSDEEPKELKGGSAKENLLESLASGGAKLTTNSRKKKRMERVEKEATNDEDDSEASYDMNMLSEGSGVDLLQEADEKPRKPNASDELNLLAREFVKQKGFKGYFATSALFGSNVKNVFDEGIFQVYRARCEQLGIKPDSSKIDDFGTANDQNFDNERGNVQVDKTKVKDDKKKKGCNI